MPRFVKIPTVDFSSRMPAQVQVLKIDLFNDTPFVLNGDISFALYDTARETEITFNSASDLVSTDINPMTAVTVYKRITLPSTLEAGTYYFNIFYDFTYSVNGIERTDHIEEHSQGFTVEVLSTTKELYAFGLAGICECTKSGTTFTATIPYATNITAAVAVFSYSGKTIKIGSTVQVSGVNTNDFTSPVTYRVFAEDDSYTDYTITITKSAQEPQDVSLTVVSNDTQITNAGDIVYIGDRMDYQIKVRNNGSVAYTAETVQYVQMWLVKSGNANVPGLPAVPINVRIEPGTSVILKGSWPVSPRLQWGTENGTHYVYFKLNITISRTIYVHMKANLTRAIVFNEKLGVFSGRRLNPSPYYLALNNDFYSVNKDGLNMEQFYLQDYNDTCTEFGLSLNWSVSFFVIPGPITMVFKNIILEMGKVKGGMALVDRIEYATNTQSSTYDFQTTNLIWKPVWKDNKWHFPIKYEHIPTAIIKDRKLKGTYLKVTIKGSNEDAIFVRNMITNIVKSFV